MMPFFGTTPAGAMFVGGMANSTQYYLTEKWAYGREPSSIGILSAAALGSIAGYAGGTYQAPARIPTSDSLNRNFVQASMETYTRAAFAQNTRYLAGQSLRSFASAGISNLPLSSSNQTCNNACN